MALSTFTLLWYSVLNLSHVRLFVTPWTVAHQAPPSMELSRPEYWCGLPFPPPGDLPDLGTEPYLLQFLHWKAVYLPLSHLGSPTFTLLCNFNHHLPTELFSFHCKNEILCLLNNNSLLFPPSQPLASTLLSSASMNFTTTGASYRWNHTVFVPL